MLRRYTLQCFGGAGRAGMRAWLADALGMGRIFCHPLAGRPERLRFWDWPNQIVMRDGSLECDLSDEGVTAAHCARACSFRPMPPWNCSGRVSRRTPYVAVRPRCASVTQAPTPHLPCELPQSGSPADAAAAISGGVSRARYRRRFRVSHAAGRIGAGSGCRWSASPPVQPRAGRNFTMRLPPALRPGGARRGAHVLSRRRTERFGAPPTCIFAKSFAAGACVDGPAIIVERNATNRGRTGMAVRNARLKGIWNCGEFMCEPPVRNASARVDPVMLENLQ